MTKLQTYAQKRAKQIQLGAKFLAPRAPQRLGRATQAELDEMNEAIRRSPDAQLTEYFRQARAIGLRVAEFSIHELLAHLDEVAVEASGLTMSHDRAAGPPITIALPANPTFRQLAHAADKLIETSDDLHHIYIEGFYYTPTTGEIELTTGS